MNELQKAAAARVREAVAKTPAGTLAWPGVLAADVGLVAAAVPADRHDPVTRMLEQGAAAAARDHGDGVVVHQVADQLRHLLSLLPAE